MGLLKFIDIDGRHFAWHDLLQRRRAQRKETAAAHRGEAPQRRPAARAQIFTAPKIAGGGP
jgi:hypothetical protein